MENEKLSNEASGLSSRSMNCSTAVSGKREAENIGLNENEEIELQQLHESLSPDDPDFQIKFKRYRELFHKNYITRRNLIAGTR